MDDMRNSERWIVGALLAVALLTFFFPLASIQIPIVGNQELSGYDLVSRAKDIDRTLEQIKPKKLDESGSSYSPLPARASSESGARLAVPISVQTLPLIPVEIIFSFVFATAALLCCFGRLSSTPAKFFSTAGALAAVAAVLHLAVANSDLHSFIREQMKADSSAADNNPFAGFAQQLVSLAVNSVQLKPGAGLYLLAVCLSVAAVILLSRLLATASIAEVAMQPRIDQSGAVQRILLLVILFAVVIAGVFVMLHPHTPAPRAKGSFDGEFSAKNALVSLFGNYDASQRSSSVVLTGDNGEQSGGKLTLILDDSFNQGDEQKHLLVTSTAGSGEDCHACDAEIGAYVYARRDGVWTPEISNGRISRSGAWGLAGEATIVKFAPNIFGFSVTLTDGGQGEEGTSKLFITPVGGRFQPVLSLNVESDNEGDCGSGDAADAVTSSAPCYRNQSAIRFLNSVHKGLFDIEVDESGSASTDQGVVPMNGRKVYQFSGEKYFE